MILLDTCALLWLVGGDRLSDEARLALESLWRSGEAASVSPISAWEIGLLSARGRFSATMPPTRWWKQAVERPGLCLCDLPAEVLIGSCHLPGTPPNDPADRIVAATAREFGLAVMTRDRLLLAYAEAGHIQAIAC